MAQEFGKRGAVGEVHVIEVHNAKSWKKNHIEYRIITMSRADLQNA